MKVIVIIYRFYSKYRYDNDSYFIHDMYLFIYYEYIGQLAQELKKKIYNVT